LAQANAEALHKLLLDKTEQTIVQKYIDYLDSLNKKYTLAKKTEDDAVNLALAINLGIVSYSSKENGLQDSAEEKYLEYENDRATLSSYIYDMLTLSPQIKEFSFHIDKPMAVSDAKTPYGDLCLVSRFACKISQIDSTYMKALICSTLKKEKPFPKTDEIEEKDLTDCIANADEEGGKNGLELLKAKVEKQISNDFSSEKAIVKNGEPSSSDYSAGVNATDYFEILSYAEGQKIYLFDQPEDDVSQTSISKYVLTDLRRMRHSHQIILVTHNPQFVVNLDADNVIYLSKKDGHFLVQSGALEYEEENGYNILQIIEDNLDGGEESIRKRWKRYDKNN
jgi:hypothetical protein